MKAGYRFGASGLALALAGVAGPAWAQSQTGAMAQPTPAQAQSGEPATPPAAASRQAVEPATAADPLAVAPAGAGPDPQTGAQPGDVVVTGSRLVTGFALPTPVSVVSSESILKTAPTSLGEGLRQIPALSSSSLSTNSGSGSAVSAANGQSLLNLRNLGSNRTLVLLDGARLGVTNVVNSVDTNIIPQRLVKRVDVVTGGASASYGSDAVSGVVNFILDTTYQGLKLEADVGSTFRGDAGNVQFSGAFGHKFGDKARLIGSVEVFREDAIPYGYTGRTWFDQPVGEWTNPVAGARPTLLTPAGTRSSNASYGGVISAISGCPAGAAACTALAGKQFLQGGVLGAFNPGTSANSQFGIGGDGAIVTNGLSPKIERESYFLHGEYDVAPRVTLWVEGLRSRNYTLNEAQTPVQNLTTPFRIFEGNPYLPSAVASLFAATPGTQSFTLSRYDLDMSRVLVKAVTTVTRGAGGIKGSLSDLWSFDGTASYQHSVQQLDIYNTIQRNIYAASDAVTNPATGQIVCRSTYFTPSGTFVPGGTGNDVGCVPLNLFGPNSVSQAGSNYVMGWNNGDVALNQLTAEANLHGRLPESVSLGAGAISVALGGAYRRLTARRTVDPLSASNIDFTGLRVCNATSTPACTGTITSYPASLQGRYGSYQYYNPSPLSGEVSVYEGYGELGIPILKDKPFFQALDATLAGRMTHYSQSGWEPTWKLGLNWAVNSSLRLRGTYSADSRAPSVLELFNTAQVLQGRNRTPASSVVGAITSSGQNITLGNPDLSPEKARTITAGFVFTPDFIPRLQLSADYYKIAIKDSIISLGAQNIVDLCYGGDAYSCSQILVNGNPITSTSNITASDFVVVYDRTLNYAKDSTSGIDISAAYRVPIGGASLSFNLDANYLLHAYLRGGCATTPGIDQAGYIATCSGGAVGGLPRIKGRISVNYQSEKFGLYVQERLVGGGKKNRNYVEGIDISENNVPATFYTDFTFTVSPQGRNGRYEWFFQATNVLDQDPRATLILSRSWIEPSDLNLYDALGRRFVTGVRLKF